MRSLVDVIDAIVKVAPDLSTKLSSVRCSAKYASPEMMGYWWNETAYVLNENARHHAKAEEIHTIFSGV